MLVDADDIVAAKVVDGAVEAHDCDGILVVDCNRRS
jgi:hypothetical protein